MPMLTTGRLLIDYTDEGAGAPVVLLHSSVSGNRQWRPLAEALRDRYRVLALNLFGYGATTPWPDAAPQSLYGQAQLVLALCEAVTGPIHLVGHSFGGAVALKAAMLLGPQVASLTLLEPNPFYLLAQADRTDAYLEVRALRDHVKCYGALGDWATAAARFADYWLGDGAWAAMPTRRRDAFVAALPPSYHEWDAVMDEVTTIAACRALGARTLVVSDPATRRPIQEIVALLAASCPRWTFRTVAVGGHMAPLTHPQLVNPLIRQFLDAGGA